MEQEYYKDYYKLERKHWWFVAREKIIIDTFERISNKKSGLKILNVGCATGRSTEYLSQYGEVTSIEYNEDCCKFLREELKMPVINASATDLPLESESYDWVCSLDVVEHIEDHEKAVQEMARVLKPGGHIFLTVPAFMDLWSKHDLINHHFRRYKMDELTSLFKPELNGNIIYKTYFNSILFPLIWIFRKISSLFIKDMKYDSNDSDFDDPDKNKVKGFIFYNIFYLEKFLLRKMSFPFGVSAMVVWQKKA